MASELYHWNLSVAPCENHGCDELWSPKLVQHIVDPVVAACGAVYRAYMHISSAVIVAALINRRSVNEEISRL